MARKKPVPAFHEAAKCLHDTAGQTLTSLGVELDLLRMDYGHVEGLGDRTRKIQATLQKAFDEVKGAMDTLNREAERYNRDDRQE